MPDVRNKQENREDARRDQLADKGASKEAGAGKAVSQEEVKQAAQDLRQQASQSNTSSAKEVQSSHNNLGRYAEHQGALKGLAEPQRQELQAALQAFGGRQEAHLAARQTATDRVAEAAQGAVANLAERQAKELQQAPEAERGQVADRHQAQWTDARKILEETRGGIEALRTADDARLRETRDKVLGASAGTAGELSARLEEDKRSAEPLRADLDRDARRLLDHVARSFEALRDVEVDAVGEATAALREAEQRASKALDEATQRAENERKSAQDEMALRHDREGQAMERLRPGDGAQRRALVEAQRAQQLGLAKGVEALQRRLEELRKSLDQQAQRWPGELEKAVGAKTSGALKRAQEELRPALQAIAEKAKGLVLENTQVVRESNLFYDFDHWEPQSKNPKKSNKASNLGFLTADENRRKGAKEFENLPGLQEPVSLKDALDAGEDATRKVVGAMLGSLRFSEVAELNVLWQRASDNETRSYADSQAAFRQLIGGDNAKESEEVQMAADSLRRALKTAKVEIVPNESSFRLRLDDSEYRR